MTCIAIANLASTHSGRDGPRRFTPQRAEVGQLLDGEAMPLLRASIHGVLSAFRAGNAAAAMNGASNERRKRRCKLRGVLAAFVESNHFQARAIVSAI